MHLEERVNRVVRRILPASAVAWVALQRRKYRVQWPRVGSVDFGGFDRITPVSTAFGYDRGQPIDRHYIEMFMAAHAEDIKGRCLEIADRGYTDAFGQGVTQSDVLHYVEGNPEATLVGDLTNAPHIPDDSYDCVICTQTVQMIFEPRDAFATIYRILKPGGVALITTAGIATTSQHPGDEAWGEYWHFTGQALQRMSDLFWPRDAVTVTSYGNVMTACCYLQGLAAEELLPEHFEYADRNYEVIVAARLQKPAGET